MNACTVIGTFSSVVVDFFFLFYVSTALVGLGLLDLEV